MGWEFIQALALISMAEMGDKTQLLAMAFATKYSVKKVLLGVFLGSLLNHGIAVVLGVYLSDFIPLDTLSLIAATAFIVFGLWSLKPEGEEEAQDTGVKKFGPVLTVAFAFFLGEIGDKTQLAVITLSTQGSYPLLILGGTVLGMVITSGVGVLVGMKLGKKIPEVGLKIGSGIVFMIFGYTGLLGQVDGIPLSQGIMILLPGALLFSILIMGRKLVIQSRIQTSSYRTTAEELRLNTQRIRHSLEAAKDENHSCEYCENGSTTIEELQEYLEKAEKEEAYLLKKEFNGPLCSLGGEEKEKLKDSLRETISVCEQCSKHRENCIGNQTRRVLESMVYGEEFKFDGNREKYCQAVKELDPDF
ncbi:TMEM165/GDT1 family protein [Isachenkonia alkalipeptolytica]|nr:TMEM165/GDT1 family protein [Isachenkonia alkalipeptolytica]